VIVIASLYILLRMNVRSEQKRYSSKLDKKVKENNLLSVLLTNLLGKDTDAFSFQGFTEKTNPVTVGFKDLKLVLKDGRVVLNKASGEFRNSTISAVMGPSGSGKSSFLNVLTGKATYGKMSGKIYLNGFRERLSDFRRQIGFVPQDDICFANLTVRENLTFNAKLRLPKKTDNRTVQAVVDDVLKVLGLTHVQHSLVGSVESRGISGGQRKRVNIGMELCAYPDILFLDEPTSGLDSTASLDIIQSLTSISRLGVTVISVIHQPRYGLFKLFDDVLFLGEGGKTVYMGRTDLCESYFSRLGFPCPTHENPADFYMDIISGNVKREGYSNFRPEDLHVLWEANNKLSVRMASDVEHSEFQMEDDLESQSLFTRITEPIFRMFRARRRGYNRLADSEVSSGLIKVSASSPLDYEEIKAIAPNDGKYFDMYREPSLGVGDEDNDIEAKADILPVHYSILREAFQKFDHSKTGRLGVNEIKEMMASFGGECEEEDVLAIIHALSIENRDSITFDDLMAKFVRTRARIDNDLSRKTLICSKAMPLERRKRHMIWTEIRVMLRRNIIQGIREFKGIMFDFVLLIFSASIVGFVYGSDWEYTQFQMMTMLTVVMMGMIAANVSLRIFGNDRVVFWRESSAGIVIFAYYLAKIITNAFELFVYPLIFTTMIYNFIVPLARFQEYYLIYMLVFFVNSGMGMLISSIMAPKNALLAAVLFPLVLGGFFSGVFPALNTVSPFLQHLSYASFSRWGIEAITIKEAAAFPAYIPTETVLFSNGYENTLDEYHRDIRWLIILGFGFRILALIALHTVNRAKRQ